MYAADLNNNPVSLRFKSLSLSCAIARHMGWLVTVATVWDPDPVADALIFVVYA